MSRPGVARLLGNARDLEEIIWSLLSYIGTNVHRTFFSAVLVLNERSMKVLLRANYPLLSFHVELAIKDEHVKFD